MALSPDRLFTVGSRRLWGRLYGVSEDVVIQDALDHDAINPRAAVTTGLIETREPLVVSDIIKDDAGTAWTVTNVTYPDRPYGGRYVSNVQKDAIVLG